MSLFLILSFPEIVCLSVDAQAMDTA